ncbi:MAG: riboflavin biosynthesis protein RibF [Alphaproteobacteria bacterium]
MLFFRQSQSLARALPQSVLIIGNFDGLHRGHQAAIQYAQTVAMLSNKPLTLLTFEPHPKQTFNPDLPPFRLTPITEKIHIAQKLKLDAVLALRFSTPLANQSAKTFANHLLKQQLSPTAVIIGENFRFGKNRTGNHQTLKDAFLNVHVFPSQREHNGKVISTSLIRKHIRNGTISEAHQLLGRHFHIHGRIQTGQGRGQKDLGIPTANIHLHPQLIRPHFGIYAVKLAFTKSPQTLHNGVASLGINPMFPLKEPRLEVHLFSQWGNLTGQNVRVSLIQKIRNEQKFNSIADLAKQIQNDCLLAKQILKNQP